MGLKKRTYELFEAGGGKLNLTRLQQFAEATDTDAYAILISLAYGDETFALRCADQKLMTAAVMSIQDFNADIGDDLGRLDARIVMQAFDAACSQLAQIARQRGIPSDDGDKSHTIDQSDKSSRSIP